MIKQCVFDADGNLINIGEWDYGVQPGQVGVDEENNPVYEDQPINPLPDGAYTEDREVEYSDEYGWRLAGTPLPKSPEERIAELQQQDLDNKEAIAALYEMLIGGGASE